MMGMTKMEFMERAPFGRTGLRVSRIGLVRTIRNLAPENLPGIHPNNLLSDLLVKE